MFQTTNHVQYVYVCVQQKPSAPKHAQRWKMTKVVVHHTPMMIRRNQLLVYPQNQQGWFKFCTRPSESLMEPQQQYIFSKIICQSNKWRCPKSWGYHCWGMFHYKTSIYGVPRFMETPIVPPSWRNGSRAVMLKTLEVSPSASQPFDTSHSLMHHGIITIYSGFSH